MKQVLSDHFIELLESRNVSREHMMKQVGVTHDGIKISVPWLYKYLVDELVVDYNHDLLTYGARDGKPYFEVKEGNGVDEPHFLIVDWSKLDKGNPDSKVTFFAVNILEPTGNEIKDKVMALRHANALNDFHERYESKMAEFTENVVGMPVVIAKKGLLPFKF